MQQALNAPIWVRCQVEGGRRSLPQRLPLYGRDEILGAASDVDEYLQCTHTLQNERQRDKTDIKLHFCSYWYEQKQEVLKCGATYNSLLPMYIKYVKWKKNVRSRRKAQAIDTASRW